jgi:hypothetical protein
LFESTVISVYSEYPVLVNGFCRTDRFTINRNDSSFV